jgi:hypothetical protein
VDEPSLGVGDTTDSGGDNEVSNDSSPSARLGVGEDWSTRSSGDHGTGKGAIGEPGWILVAEIRDVTAEAGEWTMEQTASVVLDLLRWARTDQGLG